MGQGYSLSPTWSRYSPVKKASLGDTAHHGVGAVRLTPHHSGSLGTTQLPARSVLGASMTALYEKGG